MRKGYLIALLLFAGIALAAWSSSSTTTGTEHAAALVKGSAAEANVTVFPVKLSGPVNTTGTVSIGSGGNKTGDEHTVGTKAGDLVIRLDQDVSSPAPTYNASCAFHQVSTVPVSVVGSKSTGSFAGASGKLGVTVAFGGTFPKSAGKCPNPNNNNVNPISSTVYGTFAFSGPLTIKSLQAVRGHMVLSHPVSRGPLHREDREC